ncbi:MAG: hypothetical protein JEZ14_08250 [Marinilabiliaceae bacterium]|nr:hypothetical protein [Marinilabiliaceae bacterium]
MRDAYDLLFKHISREKLFDSAIEDIVFVEENLLKEQWENQKLKLLNGVELSVRGYGRDGDGTRSFMKLYEKLFGHDNIKRDSSNNAAPTKLLAELTPYYKKERKTNPKELIQNYKIAHLFGRTKNPLLFNAAWNIAYIPTYLDPFTGHESTGEHSEAFKAVFTPIITKRFKDYILDYNAFVNENIEPKLDEALTETRKALRINKDDFERFEREAKIELSVIKI